MWYVFLYELGCCPCLFGRCLLAAPLPLLDNPPSDVAAAEFQCRGELWGHFARLLLVGPHVELPEVLAVRELRRQRLQRLTPDACVSKIARENT